MRDQGLGSWPARRARMSPGSVALVEAGRITTYAELETAATRVAHGLRARGVGRGDRVAFLGLNSAALVSIMLGVGKLGAVFLPLNTRLAPPELGWILGHSGARLLVVDTGHPGTGFAAAASGPEVGALVGAGLEVLRIDSQENGGPRRDVDVVEAIDEPVSREDLFMIQYTSGTSGRPKGVMLTHANIVWNVYNLLVDVDVRHDEVALVTAPLFHTAALNQVLFPTLLKGGTVLVEPRFDPEAALGLIEEHGVTMLFGVTSMYLALAQSPSWSTADLRSLRTALSGGAPIPESLLHTWRDRGLMIVQGYGLTEASPGATMLRPPDDVRKLGTAGTACFFSDVRVVGPDLRPVADGEPGEVLVEGPNVTSGYWNDPAATAAAFTDDGWLRTGDLAVQDDEGFVRIVDRLKDMFISGGENVYPAEVEQALHTHPAVGECAVVGVPDDRWGEVGRAVVRLRSGASLTAEDLLSHLDGRLARYKIPRSVVFVEDLPHTASGKLIRARVRELVAADHPTDPPVIASSDRPQALRP